MKYIYRFALPVPFSYAKKMLGMLAAPQLIRHHASSENPRQRRNQPD
jgi:hypothetical protein